MKRIALAILLLLGITSAAAAQPKKADAPEPKKLPAGAHGLTWDRDAHGQWAIGPVVTQGR